jgi:integrase
LTGNHGRFNRLASEYLNSAAFVRLAPETQRTRRYCAERLLDRIGKLKVADLSRPRVEKILTLYKPGQARIVLSVLRALMALAIQNGDREDDPTLRVKLPKLSSDGWHTWTEDEIAQFEARHQIGSKARLAFALALYTGQRSADLIHMGRQYVRDNKINVAQQKTKARLWIPFGPATLGDSRGHAAGAFDVYRVRAWQAIRQRAELRLQNEKVGTRGRTHRVPSSWSAQGMLQATRRGWLHGSPNRGDLRP